MTSTNKDLIDSAKQSLATLKVQRAALESEAAAITSELTAPLESGNGPPIGIDTPLVDSDGYPRADIDVHRARTLRGRLAVIRTDHRQLMRDIDGGLQRLAALQNPAKVDENQAELAARRAAKPKPKYDPISGKWVVQNWDGSLAGAPAGETRSFATLQATASETTGTSPTSSALPATNNSTNNSNATSTTLSTNLRPFAKINAVASHSPAQTAGLQEDDLVLRFGDIGLDSPDGFTQLAKVVPEAAAAHSSIEIVVQRGNGVTQTLKLQPRPWEGRGLLGCHIVPFQN